MVIEITMPIISLVYYQKFGVLTSNCSSDHKSYFDSMAHDKTLTTNKLNFDFDGRYKLIQKKM